MERIKNAIDKARRERVATGDQPAHAPAIQPERATVQSPAPREPAIIHTAPTSAAVQERWLKLPELKLDTARLQKSRIVTHDKSDPSHISFDSLRTRMLRVFKANNWSRIAITSPTKGCGKTVVAMNLAFSLSRQSDYRTFLMDLDLKAPSVANYLKLLDPRQAKLFLTGQTRPQDFLTRVGENLMLGLNTARVRESAEVMSAERTSTVFAETSALYQPDVSVFDMPPMFVSDDALAFAENVDCIMLVAAAGQTTAAEIEECELLLAEHTNFLGVVLNKCDETPQDYYG